MTMATYNLPGQRIGKIKGQILKHALHTSTVEISGQVYREPTKAGDTVIFRQVVPFGATASAPNVFSTTAAAHLIQEGSTPAAESLTTMDVSVQVQKYGCLYGYTERQASLGEDDIPEWMEEQIGERLGLVRELIYTGALAGCTNRFYAGGTTRLTTDETLGLNILDRINRNLRGNHAMFMRDALKSDGRYGTVSVQKSFLFFGHTDLQRDCEAVPGYKAIADYGSMTPVHELEIGAVGSYRIILSPDLPKIADSGASVGSTGLKSTGGSSIDVYQCFIIAKDAWGHTAFRGLDAFNYNHLKPNQVDKSDPTGERGYVSATFYDAGVVTNHGFMAVLECGASDI